MNRRSGTIYTPQKTRDYEKAIAEFVAAAAQDLPAVNEDDDLWIDSHFHLPGRARKDLDSLVKALWDGITMSKAVWADDKQVVSASSSATYGCEQPHIVVQVGVQQVGGAIAPPSNARSKRKAAAPPARTRHPATTSAPVAVRSRSQQEPAETAEKVSPAR